MSRYYVGLDVHMKYTTVCVLDRDGKRVKRQTIAGCWTKVAESLKTLPGKVSVCFEASTAYGYLYELLSKVADHVVVAHPGQLRLIFRSKKKNDRADAEKLAKLLFLGEVPVVYVPTQDVRAWRQLVEYRRRLIAKRTRAKNALRAILRTVGQRPPTGFGLWTSEGLRWLAEVDLPGLTVLQRDLLIDELMLFNQQVKRTEKELQKHSEGNPAVAVLRTIPGVGIRTAEAVVAYLDNPDRFANSKQLGSYFGLVPSQDQSGSTNRLGHITHAGPSAVRHLLAEAAWQGVRRSPTIQNYFERIQQGNKERKKIALVATAHYLVRVMYAMLRDNRPWRDTILAA